MHTLPVGFSGRLSTPPAVAWGSGGLTARSPGPAGALGGRARRLVRHRLAQSPVAPVSVVRDTARPRVTAAQIRRQADGRVRIPVRV